MRIPLGLGEVLSALLGAQPQEELPPPGDVEANMLGLPRQPEEEPAPQGEPPPQGGPAAQSGPAPQGGQTGADIASAYNATLQALLARLYEPDNLTAPQRGPVGIDSPEEVQRLVVTQLLTGDTALTGDVSQAMVDDEARAVEIAFQNAMVQHELDKLRLQMRQQATVTGIEATAQMGRLALDAFFGDETNRQRWKELGLQDEELELRRLATKAEIDAAAARTKAELWKSPEVMLLAEVATDPAASPEDRQIAGKELVARGLYTPESLPLLEKFGPRYRKFAGIAQAVTTINAQYAEQEAAILKGGAMPGEGFYAEWQDTLRRVAAGLTPEELEAFAVAHPAEYALLVGNKGSLDIQLPPQPVTPEQVVEIAHADLINQKVLDLADVVQRFTRLPPKVQAELRKTLEESVAASFSGATVPPIVLSILRGEDISAYSPDEQARAMRMGLGLRGIHGQMAATWFMAQTGMNPLTAAYDPATGRIYEVAENAAMALWRNQMDNKPTELVVAGNRVAMRALLPYLARTGSGGRTASLERDDTGAWRVVFSDKQAKAVVSDIFRDETNQGKGKGGR